MKPISDIPLTAGLNQYLQEKHYATTGTPGTCMVTVQSQASQVELPKSNHVIKATKAPVQSHITDENLQ